MTTPTTRLATAVLAATTLTAAGCGAQVQPDATGSSAGYPVTVENCGRQVTFDSKPARVVTNDIGITELMFALGLEERMAGYVLSDGKRAAIEGSPWRASYREVEHLTERTISKEVVLGAQADMVFAGWNYGFTEETGVTPRSLRALDIGSYVLTESCRNDADGARGVMPPLQALYTDLYNLGRIFRVEDRARRLVAQYKRTVRRTESRATPDARPPRVFLYDDGENEPLSAGRFAGPHEIITRAGGRNILADVADSWTRVGWETVVDRDPEVIIINDYGDTSAEQKRRFLESYGPLRDVTAVEERNFFVLRYVDLVESPRNPAAIAAFGRYLRKREHS